VRTPDAADLEVLIRSTLEAPDAEPEPTEHEGR
jgi:hypothetical protein